MEKENERKKPKNEIEKKKKERNAIVSHLYICLFSLSVTQFRKRETGN